MVRKQVVVGELQNEAATELARQRGVSFSELIRELIDREVANRRDEQIQRATEQLCDAYLTDSDLQSSEATEVEGLDETG
ncbi:MAG: ribbon-helix-helix protein, CopG family [Spirochaetota bacterium]